MKISRIQLKLSIMMLLQYTIWGVWYVTLSSFLGKNLGFSGTEIGLIYGTFAIAAIISPVIVGGLTDRYFSPVSVLLVLHLLGAGVLYWLSIQESYASFYWSTLLYALCYMPTITLTNIIAFKNLDAPETSFSKVRVMGTIGWIVAGIVVSFFDLSETERPIQIASFLSILLAVFVTAIPNDKIETQSSPSKLDYKSWFNVEAFKLLKNRNFSVLLFASLLISIPLSFYFSFTHLFLGEVGVEDAAGIMTIGQVSEIGFMLALPFFIKKWGIKRVIGIAMFVWGLRYVLFAAGAGEMMTLIYIGIAVHGICYDFFFVAGQMYVDQNSPEHLKGAAQGLLTQVTYGVGMFIGAWLSGVVVDYYTDVFHNWPAIWMVPAAISFIVLLPFLILFKKRKQI